MNARSVKGCHLTGRQHPAPICTKVDPEMNRSFGTSRLDVTRPRCTPA
jgi:hypothetical protein